MKVTIFENGYWREKDIECQHENDLERVDINMFRCPVCGLFISEDELNKSREFKLNKNI